MNKFYWIPAVGEPKLIESEDYVGELWHDLMNDPDHHLCFETVHIRFAHDIVLFVDDSGKLKPHSVNLFASFLYSGTSFGDYIAGDVLIVKLKDAQSVLSSGILFCNSDIDSLSQDDIDLIDFLLEVHHGSL